MRVKEPPGDCEYYHLAEEEEDDEEEEDVEECREGTVRFGLRIPGPHSGIKNPPSDWYFLSYNGLSAKTHFLVLYCD